MSPRRTPGAGRESTGDHKDTPTPTFRRLSNPNRPETENIINHLQPKLDKLQYLFGAGTLGVLLGPSWGRLVVLLGWGCLRGPHGRSTASRAGPAPTRAGTFARARVGRLPPPSRPGGRGRRARAESLRISAGPTPRRPPARRCPPSRRP